jgi:hypothetical protein
MVLGLQSGPVEGSVSKIELDDQILNHPKFIRAVKIGGSETIHLWLGMRAYCSQNLTDGFIPSDMLDEVRGPKSEKARRSAMAALVEVNLVEIRDNGVALHDYLDWASSRDEVTQWRAKARERKAKSRTVSRQESQRDGQCDTPETPGGVTDTRSVAPAPAYTLGAPSPSPSPSASPTDQRDQPVAKDLTGIRVSAEQQQQPTKIPCPPDLCLLDAQIANLEMAGIPRWAVDQMTRDMVGKFIADTGNPRTLEAWLMSLSRAVSGDWNSGRRPKKPDPNALPPRSERNWMTAEEAGLPT